MNMRIFGMALLLGLLVAAPAAARDPLASLHFLVGSWNCSYSAGKIHTNYKATFAYDMNGNWLRENDAWQGGGDLGMFTYQPKEGWTAVVVEGHRTTTLFRASGSNPNHIVYHTVYPNANATDVFDRVSPTRFTIHYSETDGGKKMTSSDICNKA
jgi:hypothetical protein